MCQQFPQRSTACMKHTVIFAVGPVHVTGTCALFRTDRCGAQCLQKKATHRPFSLAADTPCTTCGLAQFMHSRRTSPPTARSSCRSGISHRHPPASSSLGISVYEGAATGPSGARLKALYWAQLSEVPPPRTSTTMMHTNGAVVREGPTKLVVRRKEFAEHSRTFRPCFCAQLDSSPPKTCRGRFKIILHARAIVVQCVCAAILPCFVGT